MAAVSFAAFGYACLAVTPKAAPVPEMRFGRDVRPILSEHCFKCHGPDVGTAAAGLRFDSIQHATVRLPDGAAIVPGHPETSIMLKRVSEPDPEMRMPPTGAGVSALTPSQIATLRTWIAAGAKYERHWAFVSPVLHPFPKVSDSKWCRNPIDILVLADLERHGLKPEPEADKDTLAMRAAQTLTGLPPSTEDLQRFRLDDKPGAYERYVDRLLAEPSYGEHQARYWLDAVRYGDTHGLQLDNERGIYPYRDWVIRAFNADLPYDKFVKWQVAGDLLPNPTNQQLVATGFVRMNLTSNEGGAIPEEFLARNTFDRVDTTSTVLLGLTIGCAKCHDHKYDPIKQRDYYGLYAYFDSTKDEPLDGNIALPPPAIKAPTDDQQSQLEVLDSRLDELKNAVDPTSAADWFTKNRSPLPADHARKIATLYSPHFGEANKLIRKALDDYRKAPQSPAARADLRAIFLQYGPYTPAAKTYRPLAKRRSDLEAAIPMTLIAQEMAQPRPTFILKRGQYDQKGEEVQRHIPPALGALPPGLPNNRLGLADWMTEPSNPLVARVFVNRVWQQHFGTGIIKTSEDFGSQGEWPENQPLLDYLAIKFVKDGWSVKKLNRLIVTSAAFRQSSRISKLKLARDPENRLISRGPRFRLDAEVIRDKALDAGGLLVQEIGGHGVKPYQPDGLWESSSDPASGTHVYKRDQGPDIYRRSIYMFWKRTSPPPVMITLDAPLRDTCIVRRSTTDTPLQALALLNETAFLESSRSLAVRVLKGRGGDLDHLDDLYDLTLGRPPQPAESSLLLKALSRYRREYKAEPSNARNLLKVGDAPQCETIPAPEQAAWMILASSLMNTDEFLSQH